MDLRLALTILEEETCPVCKKPFPRRTSEDIYEAAEMRMRKSGEGWSPGLLRYLSFYEPKDWIEYLESFSQWHKVRYGREMLRAWVAFLMELGIERLLALVQRIIDFDTSFASTEMLRN